MNERNDVGFVFVHGAGLGGWIWEDVAGLLDHPHVFADLPARDGSPKGLGLGDYTDAVLAQADELDAGRLVVVMHSLGGVVGLQVADRLAGRLAGIVAVSAAVPRDGGSFVSSLPAPKRWIVGALMRLFGTNAPESAIRKGLCNDLAKEQADEVVRRFVPESKAVYFERTEAQVPDVPRAYVHLTNDNEFDEQTQRAMARNLGAEDVPELATGHLPMLSKPKDLAALLNDFAAGL